MSSSSNASSDATFAVPTEAMMALMAPDGYYHYLGIPKGSGEVEEDAIKKSYRKLSLKHHPDRPNGDAGTFRVLNRAQKVLTTPKLRQQYDILGIDLDDDDDPNQPGGATTTTTSSSTTNSSNGDEGGGDDGEQQTTSQGIVHEIASMALTTVLQMGVRTVMMAFVSLLVVRYIWTLVPALGFLAFIAYRIHSVAAGTLEVLSPFIIGGGLVVMHQSYYSDGWFVFWLGESLVIGMFTYNSLSGIQKSTPVVVGVGLFSALAALWFRGKFWNYGIVLGLEAFLGLFIAMAFPIMEMVLEAILNDKLRKVGDKVRAHHQQLEKFYRAKSNR